MHFNLAVWYEFCLRNSRSSWLAAKCIICVAHLHAFSKSKTTYIRILPLSLRGNSVKPGYHVSHSCSKLDVICWCKLSTYLSTNILRFEGIYRAHWDFLCSVHKTKLMKEPINSIGFSAPFAPTIWASHWSVYEYVDKMLFVYLRSVSYNLYVGRQYRHYDLNWNWIRCIIFHKCPHI